MPNHDPKPEFSAYSKLSLAQNVTLQGLGSEEGGVLLKLDTGEMYTVNETTLSFLQALDGEQSVAAIAGQLTKEFDVDAPTITADLLEISSDLAKESLIVVA